MTISATTQGLRMGVATSSSRPTVPFEGQMIYETDTDLTYIYGGSAWQQVSGGTAVGNSGLVYITSASATSGSSLAVNNCFSSAYNSYCVIIDNTLINSTVQMTMTLGATITSYYWANLTVSYNTGVVAGSNGANAASIQLGTVVDTNAGNGAVIDILNPNLAQRTAILSTGTDNRVAELARWSQSFIANTTQYTGFTLSIGAAVFTSCNVRVYGYRL